MSVITDNIYCNKPKRATEEELKELHESRVFSAEILQRKAFVLVTVSKALASNLCITSKHAEKLMCIAHHLNLAVDG